MRIKPIKPSEADKLKAANIPDQVFAAFNELIVSKWSGHRAVILQKDAVAAVLSKMPGVTSAELFDKHWLDVEDSYREAGWKVVYDRPAYCESYEPSFSFSKT